MAIFTSLPPGAIQQVAASLAGVLPATQLGFALGSQVGADAIQEVELAESIDIWLLPAAEVEQGLPLDRAIRPLGRWHHQLRALDMPLGYAESQSGPAVDFEVALVGNERLAQAIDAAISRIDLELPGDDVRVHLVHAPAYQVIMLFARGGGADDIYVVQATDPFGADDAADVVRLPSAEFLSILRRRGPALGIVE